MLIRYLIHADDRWTKRPECALHSLRWRHRGRTARLCRVEKQPLPALQHRVGAGNLGQALSTAPKPRLLYLASSFPYGKNDTFFGPEVRELLRQGVDVLAVPVRPRGSLTTPDAEPLTLRRPLLDRAIACAAFAETMRAPRAVAAALVLLFRCRSPAVLVKNLAAFPKALWVANLARAWSADHIHAHWAGPPSTVALVASRLSGIPWSFTAHFADIEANNLMREKSESALFVRFIAQAMIELCRRTAPGSDESRWVLLHLGVDLPPPPTPRVTLNTPPVVLMAARFDPEKRHETLLHATRLLLDDGVGVDVWLAGSGSLEEKTRRLARELGVQSAVRFVGFVRNERLLEWLSIGCIDLVVLPSDAEGIPVSLIEALAHGVPAVGTTVGGVAELLGDGCGELVQPADADELAHAIARLLRSPQLRAERGRAGRARIEQEFAVESIVRRLRLLAGIGGAAEGHAVDPRQGNS
jgi:colanic acid/amylovoran biosynthesis glycosyltransferase